MSTTTDNNEVLLRSVQKCGYYEVITSVEKKKLSNSENNEVVVGKGNKDQWKIKNEKKSHPFKKQIIINLKNGKIEFSQLDPSLRSDKEVALAAIEKDVNSFAYTSDELRSDKEVALCAIKKDAGSFEHVCDELRSDKEVVIFALKQRCYGFNMMEYVDEELYSDKEVLFSNVLFNKRNRNNYSTLFYANDKFCADREFVIDVLKETGTIQNEWSYINEKLRYDQEFIASVLEIDGDFLYYLNYMYFGGTIDRKLILVALKTCVAVWRDFVTDELRADKEFITEALKRNGAVLARLSEELRADREIVMTALRHTNDGKKVLEYAHKDLRKDPFLQYLSMSGSERRDYSRKRLIRGVVEERRVRRKYDPKGPFMTRMFDKDQDELDKDLK